MTDTNRIISAAKHQNLSERDRRVVDNLPLVFAVCKRYGVRPTDDVLSAGYLGLVNAADAYQPERGAFSTFAFWCIRNEIFTSERGPWRQRQREVPLNEATAEGKTEVVTHYDELAAMRDQCERLLAAMLPQDAELIRRYCRGETQREMAKYAGKSKQAVNQQIQRGLRAARNAARRSVA